MTTIGVGNRSVPAGTEQRTLILLVAQLRSGQMCKKSPKRSCSGRREEYALGCENNRRRPSSVVRTKASFQKTDAGYWRILQNHPTEAHPIIKVKAPRIMGFRGYCSSYFGTQKSLESPEYACDKPSRFHLGRRNQPTAWLRLRRGRDEEAQDGGHPSAVRL